jgi:hypothetical protein
MVCNTSRIGKPMRLSGGGMGQGTGRSWASLAIAGLALFAALGGSVYAATRGRIEGRTVKVKSLPGNRLKLRSVPGNRLKPRSIAVTALKPGVLDGVHLATPLTGADINELTLGQVPRATHAETADYATSAGDAQTALNAVEAINAQTVNGHRAGCLGGTVAFAGACWQSSHTEFAATAPQAAIECAKQGGTLPAALELAAFAVQPGVNLDPGDEWSGDIPVVSGENAYAVVTVAANGSVDRDLSTATHKYRCVVPLVT